MESKHDIVSPAEPRPDTEVDPDPFSVGLALLGLAFTGAAYLEARRQRQLQERVYAQQQQTHTNKYRARWYAARRTLLSARQVITDSRIFMSECGYGHEKFLFGEVRLKLTRAQVKQQRSLVKRINSVANTMATDIDALSEFLGPEHQSLISHIMNKLQEKQVPHSYDAVLILAKDAIDSFDQLLANIDDRERFGEMLA